MSVSLLPSTGANSDSLLEAPARSGGVMSAFGWTYTEADASSPPSPAAPPTPAAVVEAETRPAAAHADSGSVMLNPAESSPSTLVEAMSVLQSGLAEANVDTSRFTLKASEDLQWSPFGNYYDRQIEVRMPDGQWFKLSADLTVQNPRVAVWDIQRSLGMPF